MAPAISGLPYGVFVDRMNEVVADLGMSQSTFSDPSGVEDDNLSTARDMTRAVVAAAAHPLVSPAINAPWWDVTDQTRNRTRRVRTTNKLIDRPGTEVVAGKTGYTDTARHCFTGVFLTGTDAGSQSPPRGTPGTSSVERRPGTAELGGAGCGELSRPHRRFPGLGLPSNRGFPAAVRVRSPIRS